MGAATTAGTIDALCEWVRESVCPQITSKVPPRDGNVASYVYETANPAVFEMYMPDRGRLADADGSSYPSVTVQLVDSTDSLRGRVTRFRLVLGIWSPGEFDGGELSGSMEGWREVANGLDAIRAALDAADEVAGGYVDRERGVSCGPYSEDGQVMLTYPYFFGRVDFDLVTGAPAPAMRFEGLL